MDETKNPDFEALLDFLCRTRGFDFTGYKRLSLTRRVSRRMQMVGIENYLDYRDYLEVHPDEFVHLFNSILINVTSFFRDEPAWEYLAQTVIPNIIAQKSAGEPIRVWCAGCASGEEVYTLAMLLTEALGIEAFLGQAKLYATDIDEEALTQARQASYPEKAVQAIPDALREKYFTQNGEFYNFRLDLRHNVIFGRHDLFQDAPISRLDLLVCRNTLMYFNADAQQAILNRFHFALNDNGYLFLGKAEMLLTQRQLFNPQEVKHRVFVKSVQINPRERMLALVQNGNTVSIVKEDRHIRLYELVFNSLPVAQVVVNAKGILTLINEQARQLFDLNVRDIGRPLQDLEFSYRPVELRSLIEQAFTERQGVQMSSVERRLSDDVFQYLDLQISPLFDSEANRTFLGLSIIFIDVTANIQLRNELQRTNQELETTQEELQSSNEELETTNEELQSTNEELETTNEELQSTNEELETMNEELQSTNEEFQTINSELNERSEALVNANVFLNSILTGLRAGVVVVNRQLEILEWNRRMEDLWGLRTSEVLGKSILELDFGLKIPSLTLQTFLSQENDSQGVTLDAINRRGKTIRCQVTSTKFRNPGEDWRGLILLIEEIEKAPN
jgi:two-component system, chemotaxis family, CheB/CheR fusion protein